MTTIKYYDPTADALFDKRDIPYPEKLESQEDYSRLFQHMISYFRDALNAYYNEHGYGDRQRLLVSILQSLQEVMPVIHPEYVRNYPESIDDIRMLVSQIILMSVDFTGLHPDE